MFRTNLRPVGGRQRPESSIVHQPSVRLRQPDLRLFLWLEYGRHRPDVLHYVFRQPFVLAFLGVYRGACCRRHRLFLPGLEKCEDERYNRSDQRLCFGESSVFDAAGEQSSRFKQRFVVLTDVYHTSSSGQRPRKEDISTHLFHADDDDAERRWSLHDRPYRILHRTGRRIGHRR